MRLPNGEPPLQRRCLAIRDQGAAGVVAMQATPPQGDGIAPVTPADETGNVPAAQLPDARAAEEVEASFEPIPPEE
eukprot:6491482-Amphidinium_carterae.3